MIKRGLIAFLILLAGCSTSLQMQGRKMVDQGEYDRAIDLYYQEIKANPQSADAWRELGVAFYHKGDTAKAEEALEQAAKMRPDARTSLYLGLVYEKEEHYGKAIDAFRAALSLKPSAKTKHLITNHLDGLVSKKVEQEVTTALRNESSIDVDTIPENTIAVVDFDNSHLPPDLAPLSKGLAEFTAMDLAKVQSLRVVDRLKIDAIMREQALGQTGYVDAGTAPRMGRLLGSRRIVTGSVLGVGDKIRLDGAIVNAGDSSATRTESLEEGVKQFFAVQKDFVFKVIDQMGITLTADERNAIQQIPTESYLALMAYCRGLDYKGRGMYDEAQQEFKQASQEDKGFQQASVEQEVMARAVVAGAGGAASFDQFATTLQALSNLDLSIGGMDQFQNGILDALDFVPDLGNLDRFGNTDDLPLRTDELNNIGIIIIRGNLDVQP
jgi:tetratricopeptide (TPR) repeat protein